MQHDQHLPPLPKSNEQKDQKESSNCRVVIRVKPAETFTGNIWMVDFNESVGGGIQICDEFAAQNKKRQDFYAFDAAFEDSSDNRLLYETVAKDAVNSFMKGENAVVFAYGQTASGKTYSMMGNDANPGIIPQAVAQIFDFIKESSESEYLLRVSYLEIYNETLSDLLNPHQKDLRIHEDSKRGVYVTPLKEELVSSPTQVMRLIRDGEMNRKVSQTTNNAESSRSHTIVQFVLESSSGENRVVVSHLHLIDLAGSEKASVDQQRQKEGSFINRSLLTLATVISRLTAEEEEGEQHIPFRESKLTRLLQPSLLGKSKICVVATLNPYARNVEESLNTLKFASRVKKIIARPELFKLSEKALLKKYKNEVETLKHQLDDFNQSLIAKTPQKLPDDEKTKYEEKLEEARLASIRLKEWINHLTKLILTSKSVLNTKPLFKWESSQDTYTVARAESIMIEDGLLPASNLSSTAKVSSSMPALFALQNQKLSETSSGERNDKEDVQHLTSRKLQILVSFIKTLKKAVERKEELSAIVKEFKLDTFVERRLSIPDLKLEAALKRVNDLKDEKNQLEVVLMDNQSHTSTLQKQISELKELIAFNEKDHNELSALAAEQQDMIEDLQRQLQSARLEFLEYRDLVGKRKGPPTVSNEVIKTLENSLTSDNKLSNVSRHELSNLIAYLRVAADKDWQVLY